MTRRNSQAPYSDISFAAKSEIAVISETDKFWTALYTTPHGYAWGVGDNRGPTDADGYTRIWFAHQGREYVRTYERFYGRKWAARMATEFALEVMEGKVQP